MTASDDAIDLVVEELADRYGEPPAEVDGLVRVARLRRRAARSGLSDVVAMGRNLRIAPAQLPESRRVRLARLYPKAKLLAGGEAMVVPLPDGSRRAATQSCSRGWSSCSMRCSRCRHPLGESSVGVRGAGA